MKQIPWLCDEDIYVGTDWRSLACNPTYGMSCMQIVFLFGFLTILRKFAKTNQREWENAKALAADARRRSKQHQAQGSNKEPLLSVEEGDSEGEEDDTDCATALTQWVGQGCQSGRQLVFRLVLQTLQWWVLAALIFVYFLFSGIETIVSQYDIALHKTWWRLEEPETFKKNGIPTWLSLFSIHTLIACVVIYAISLACILLQVLTHFQEICWKSRAKCFVCSQGSGMLSWPRDVVVQVLLLPVVYTYLALESVQCLWSLMTGNTPPALEARGLSGKVAQSIQLDVFECNFAVADMYEAWALFRFGKMIAKVLQPELRKKIKMDVVKAYEGLLLIDVTVFVLVCAVGAIYSISLTWVKWRLGIDICEVQPALCSLQPYILGANWAVSSVAIYNLFTVEVKFHHLHNMQMFGPRLKFYSIKLMVFVSFWDSLIMSVLRDALHLTELEAKLFDASLRIYVMAVVAIMQIAAWWPWTSWYSVVAETIYAEQPTGNMKRRHSVLKTIGVKSVPRGTISLVRRLFPEMSEEQAEEWSNVSDKIGQLNQNDMYRVLYIGSQLGWAVPSEITNPEKVTRKGLFSFSSSSGQGKSRTALIDAGIQDQKDALIGHLQSLYPDE
eukprot:TRINITY_DN69469_c0_g1_i1.p1 TRINITY_DN69469_c0_g1~~TRINITY_DN69469_c0_g1_i1.p1  ORF type:complete len:614 (+),score=107.35 TRINITY_DN69469_c0_g1_i1:86-1927(+)